MSVVVFGYHQMGAAGLRVLLECGVPIGAVFTYEDDARENCWFDSVAEIARSAALPVFATRTINDGRWLDHLRRIAPDVIFSLYYRHILGRAILELPRLGAVNLHGSLLPRYRGRCPLNWQLVNGERESGVTLHYMVSRADAGDIIGQERVGVGPDTTALELYNDLVAAGERLLARHLDGILGGTAVRVPQDESRASVFGGRRPEDGKIDWRLESRRIHDLVRAVAPPWPGAFSDGPAGRWKVHRTRTLSATAAPSGLEPGVLRVDGERVFAGTGDGLIELVEYEPPSGVCSETGGRIG